MMICFRAIYSSHSVQEFFDSYVGNFMREEREAAVRWRLCRLRKYFFLFRHAAAKSQLTPGDHSAQCAGYASAAGDCPCSSARALCALCCGRGNSGVCDAVGGCSNVWIVQRICPAI
jgi:hypothetical protein